MPYCFHVKTVHVTVALRFEIVDTLDPLARSTPSRSFLFHLLRNLALMLCGTSANESSTTLCRSGGETDAAVVALGETDECCSWQRCRRSFIERFEI